MVYDMYKMSPMQCRILLIEGYLPDNQYEQLALNTTYAVNAAKGEGQCLPLMEYMSCGTPAIAPRHSGMRDYINPRTAFVVECSREPSYWPHDPRVTLRTLCYRINFESMVGALRDSHALAKKSPGKYRKMAAVAREMMQQYCSVEVVEEKLGRFFRVHEQMRHPFELKSTPMVDRRPGWRRFWPLR